MHKEIKIDMFNSLLLQLKWTTQMAADNLNYSDRQIRNYKNGTTEIPDKVITTLKEKYLNKFPNVNWDPHWVRIKDFKYDETLPEFIYGLKEDSEIEIYSILSEKDKFGDKRLYIKFVNTIISKNKKDIIDFMSKYGFIGISNTVSDSGDYIKLIDSINSFYLPSGFFTDKTVCFKEDIKNFILRYSNSNFSEDLKAVHCEFGTNIKGYFELGSEVKSYWARDVLSTLDNFNFIKTSRSYDLSELYDLSYLWIKTHFQDLVPYVNNQGYHLDIKYGFKTLLSYMFYEIYLDFQNNITPVRCSKCFKYFIPNKPDELICEDCLN